MTRALGCKKPLVPPHQTKLSFRVHVAMALAAALPDSVDFRNEAWCVPVKDQGDTGSCEGHSSSAATQERLAAKGTPLGFTPSEKSIYDGARSVDRARSTPIGTALPKLTDDGAMTEDVLSWIGDTGVRARTSSTSDGRNSDCESATINVEETLANLEAAVPNAVLIAPKHAIDPTASDMVQQCCAALTAKIPLRVDSFVDSKWFSYNAMSPALGPSNESDPNGGGHAYCVVGYRKNSDGSVEFLVKNSWGIEWGIAGYAWLSQAAMGAAWAITPWDVSLAN